MSRNGINYVLDALLAVAGLGMVFTGLTLEYVLPRGQGGGRLWGASRHDWGELHFYFGLGMIAVVFTHVLMHWEWVTAMTRRLFGPGPGKVKLVNRLILGAVTTVLVAGVMGGTLWYASTQVTPGGGEGGERRGRGMGRELREESRAVERNPTAARHESD